MSEIETTSEKSETSEILLEFLKIYDSLMKVVQKADIADIIKSYTIQNLDQGFMWFREGFINKEIMKKQEIKKEEPKEESIESSETVKVDEINAA